MANAWHSLWRGLFENAPISPHQMLALERYTLAVLSGLATARMMQGPIPTDPSTELRILRDTLVRELTQPPPDTRR
jgi:hypothetical protein